MIKIVFYTFKGGYSGFKINGHSNFDVKGKDIVCAAISALSQHTAKMLVKHCGARIVARQEGLLEVALNNIDNFSNVVLSEFKESIEDLQSQYPRNISLEVKEDANRHTVVCS
ncbi:MULTISPECIES: ribosomal-processing cysteine protease Prp [Pseudothermotoga]|jgi:hypothetical protein|uniref:Ribosomal processing cysteine protease Prp n=1 Tax=Pseudothermotoga lettingae (strain ATCC BAA-301 / DSM 14385 / NBRC 107922 / TMO) TaxID=416591 RepID=A8F8P8_PSELT|nr:MULTISPECIES: ribosomal-processing cysteine protease Prp [Pseudothermotoga]ABV34532.1 protein of unknown function DUF464 [Pseudothermotoga lettingae TMO]KUK20875.1 MAG: Uncharacterized protein XD56_1199 [Pseudothermotoga lettingae]MDK2883523.1 uncharacterized protein [Pseudothermotoga sp.]GLI48522.1 hypothetical protein PLETTINGATMO_06910 [Pseudothermotoga lettingae TMO]HBJ81529.1 ribosomal-processing cysteine protease Prp [Pseudothermotoga sp.]